MKPTSSATPNTGPRRTLGFLFLMLFMSILSILTA